MLTLNDRMLHVAVVCALCKTVCSVLSLLFSRQNSHYVAKFEQVWQRAWRL